MQKISSRKDAYLTVCALKDNVPIILEKETE